MNSKLEKKEINLEKSFLSIFITTFTTIFIAELGDKTQIATLMLSAESGKPIIVFLGSSLALISSSVVGVLIGNWLSKKISPSKFALFTGALMIIVSLFLAYDTFKNYL
tara:strand:+ start:584 stop:910 length:327 start_codon:yes stop_codon:yes gene_type:complete